MVADTDGNHSIGYPWQYERDPSVRNRGDWYGNVRNARFRQSCGSVTPYEWSVRLKGLRISCKGKRTCLRSGQTGRQHIRHQCVSRRSMIQVSWFRSAMNLKRFGTHTEATTSPSLCFGAISSMGSTPCADCVVEKRVKDSLEAYKASLLKLESRRDNWSFWKPRLRLARNESVQISRQSPRSMQC